MPNAQLVELYAKGLGIIDEAQLEFAPGFNVLTGETGAGKTLLIGALNLCLGGDGTATRYAQSPALRTSAVFLRPDGTEIALTRESGVSGRLRSTINGVGTSAVALREAADALIVIHGQHDSLSLRTRSDVLRIIDHTGRIDSSPLHVVRARLIELRESRARFGGDRAQRERELEFLAFQVNEIESTGVNSLDDINELVEELTQLSELRDSQVLIRELLERLDGDGDDAVFSEFARWIERLPRSGAISAVRGNLFASLESARSSLRELAALSDPAAVDEARITVLESRIAQLRNLTRKYGGSLRETLIQLRVMRQEIEVLLAAEKTLASIDEEIVNLTQQEVSLSGLLLRERTVAAAELTKAVEAELPRVALNGAQLRFRVDGTSGANADILFSANPGMPEAPLQTLASGGELSRVLLAVALRTASDDVVAVFDEVDAGIGGQVAQQIGECLRELAQRQQVIAVTHLASVAAKADRHFVVEKVSVAESTVTRVRALNHTERVDEVARMLAGSEMTSESRALARRLLETSR